MNNFKIKKAEVSDIPIILSFIKKLAEYEKLSHEVTATNKKLEETLFSKNTNAFSIIGYLNDKPVTFAIYFFNYSTFLGKKGLYLEDLFVLSEFRSFGIGKKMLKHLATIALENNCGRIEWSVLDWNEPAIKFYKKIGAEIKSEWLTTRISGKNLEKLADKNL
ncbi:MAG: GNAT family N-acetyltransferase [Melioribacteraceae bacterium]